MISVTAATVHLLAQHPECSEWVDTRLTRCPLGPASLDTHIPLQGRNVRLYLSLVDALVSAQFSAAVLSQYALHPDPPLSHTLHRPVSSSIQQTASLSCTAWVAASLSASSSSPHTLPAPSEVRPQPGVFLEYAPIRRRHDIPFGRRDACQDTPDAPTHGEQLDALDANLTWFGAEDAQVLEYWLDVSRFSRWRRENVIELPWDAQALADDLRTYAARGIRRVTSFAVWIDGEYVRRFGEPPIREYGAALLGFVPG